MGRFMPNVKQQFLDGNGDPLAGGLLYSYVAGSTTPLTTYSDNEVTQNANPVVLDARGEADVWLAASNTYKLTLTDSDGNEIWTVDNVSGDPTGASGGGGGWSAWAEHTVTDGQSATDLTDETADGASYSSAIYEYEVIRGTTVLANGRLVLQYLNTTWQLIEGSYESSVAHGVTWSVSQTTTVAQLRAALDSGAGNGTIKLSRKLVPA